MGKLNSGTLITTSLKSENNETVLLGNRVVLFGSSSMDYCTSTNGLGKAETTDGFWFYFNSAKDGAFDLVANYGTGGYNSDQILASMDNVTVPYDIGVIALGGNDLIAGTITGAQCLEKLDQALAKNWNNGAKYAFIYIQHTRSSAAGHTGGIMFEISNYREGVVARASQDSRLYIIDAAASVRNPADPIGATHSYFLAPDGIHLNESGARTVGFSASESIPVTTSNKWNGDASSLGNLITTNPTLEVDWVATNSTKSYSSANNFEGVKVSTTNTDGFLSIVVDKTKINASKKYKLCSKIKNIYNAHRIGIYIRDNAASNIWSAGRYFRFHASSEICVTPTGERFSIVSSSFSIPQSVIDSTTLFVVGIVFNSTYADGRVLADVTQLALVELAG